MSAFRNPIRGAVGRIWFCCRQRPRRNPPIHSSRARPSISISASAASGTYDYYGRLVARFMGRYIPGEPTIIAQSMPGSGSFRAANFLFSAAPKDGTALGVITQTTALEDALRSPGAQYKAAEFNWIGRMTAILEVHFTWKTSKAHTIEDARQHEIPVAGTGAGSPSEGYPKLLNALAGRNSRSSRDTRARPPACWRWSAAKSMAA